PISASLNGANDGVVFVATNGTVAPQVNALYFDKDAGAGDANQDGQTDSPLNNGVDGCPGFCNTDDDLDAGGPDKRAGAANVNDDNNGLCNFASTNQGAFCTVDSNCTGGKCLNVDERDELCGRLCVGGSGLTAAGAVCSPPNGTTCFASNCTVDSDCPG